MVTKRVLGTQWYSVCLAVYLGLLHSHSSHVQLFVTPWTAALQAPLSRGFSRQEYWSRLPFPPPGNLPDPGKIHISCVSCISRQILYHWVTWEALGHLIKKFVLLRKYIIICCIHYYSNFNWVVGFFYYLKYIGTSLMLSG